MTRKHATQAALVIAAITVAGACAPTFDGSGGQRPSAARESAQRPGGNDNALSAGEVALSQANTAYDVIALLRPDFLRAGVSTSPSAGDTRPIIYVNGIRQGGLDMLRTIPADIVIEIRYVKPVDATIQYGQGHGAGVIAVRTRQ